MRTLNLPKAITAGLATVLVTTMSLTGTTTGASAAGDSSHKSPKPARLAQGAPARAAAATVTEPPRPAFYEPPAVLPELDGQLIRSEPAVVKVYPQASDYLDITRILYKSTGREGKPIAVSGIVFVPKAPWPGPGERPIIGYAPGTHGLADKCAPSRQFTEGAEYEGLMIDPLLKAGYAIAMTDYEGLGTPGIHTYMLRETQGHAVLDAVRAAVQLPNVSPTAPVGLQGYSQGGGAAAAAAELAPSYAPELNVIGAVIGAPPANLGNVAKNIDGSFWASFSFYASRAMAESYGVDLAPYLNAKGVAMTQRLEQSCVYDLLENSFKRSADFSSTGESFATVMNREPFKTMVDQQTIGRVPPRFPVMVTHSFFDDIIPWYVGRDMSRSWCKGGAKVQFNTVLEPGHGGGFIKQAQFAGPFWADRVNGQPFWGNCGWF